MAAKAQRSDRWERRRGLALLIRVVVVLAPVIVATDIGLLVATALPRPDGVAETVGWWAAVLVAAGTSLFAFDRLFRRLLPLSVLLDLALVFPGAAPSRFSSAFRAGTAKNLQRRIDQAKEDAGGADAGAAAGTVVELIAALAVHDPRTRGHSERTRAYAELIAEEMALDVADRDRLRWSALLHDIGKLHVSPSLLNKAGRPDPDEWEVLRSHPTEGARIAGALRSWLGPWGLAIEQHHERFDGTGYPARLAGEEISLGGRIVSVADAYEVMTSARSYTPPVAPEAAREELVRCAGSHFDPEVVRAFLRISIGRFPKGAGLLVALGQVPGFLAAQRVLETSGSAVVAAAVGAALIAGGVVSPQNGSTFDKPSSNVAADVAEGGNGGGSFTAPVLPKTRKVVSSTTTSTTEPAASTGGGGVLGVDLPIGNALSPTTTAPPSVRPAFPTTATSPTTTNAPTSTTTTATTSPSTTTTTTTTAPPSTTTSTTSPATTTTSTTSTSTTTTTTPPPARAGYYLGGTPSGQAPTPAPLAATQPTGTGAPDYDGDGAAGRTLQPSPQPETTTAVGEYQLWAGSFTGPAQVTGTPVLTLPSAVAGFGSGKGNLRAYLLDCDRSGGACLSQAIATASLNQAEWSDGSGSFATKTLTFSAANYVLAPGRTLALRLGVQQGSSALVIAYGTSTYAAFLAIDVA